MKIPLRSPEEVSWAVSLVPRLRALQASFADDPAADRENYLAQELKQALDKVPASRRASHLELLADYFPTWQATPDLPAPAAAAPSEPRRREETPSELVDRLCALAGSLSPGERLEFAAR